MLKPAIFREYDIRGAADAELLDADVETLGQASNLPAAPRRLRSISAAIRA